MSVRKRTWKNRDGSQGEAWVVAYSDRAGKRRIKSFDLKREADAFHASVSTDLRSGVHVPDSQSVMVAEAGRLWLTSCEAAQLERATLDQYRQHLELHIIPLVGAVKLSRLTAPMVRTFEDQLARDRSPAMMRKVRGSLSAILADAQERGLVGQNVVRNLRASQARQRSSRRQTAKGQAQSRRRHPNARRGSHPHRSPGRTLAAAHPDCDLHRPARLRAARPAWEDVDLARGELHVRQRADCFNALGRPKSEAGERTVPLLPMLISTLRAHRLACPKGTLDLVFPSGVGNVESHSNIVQRGLQPALIAAGVVTKTGEAKYPGLHSLRHFYASWSINRRVDGGLELPLKLVQGRLGHASITMTADTYGHLFPRGDDRAELAAAEMAFLGAAP